MSTSIYFDYGGHYVKNGDGDEWISAEDRMYPLLFKSLSAEEISYSMLLKGVCKKGGINSSTAELKLSFIPLDTRPLRKSYIVDDDDVYVYLTSMDANKCKSVLHVEKGLVSRRNQLEKGKSLGSGREEGSSVGLNYEEGVPRDCGNHGALTLYETPLEEQYEAVYNDGRDETGNISSSDDEDNGMDYSSDRSMDNNTEHEYIPGDEEGMDQFGQRWEDGLDLKEGEEFNNKKEVKAFVERGAHKSCFAFTTIKSERDRYVLKCRQHRQGCEWYLRTTKVKNSECFRVQVYKSWHTCSRASATTSSESRNSATAGLVAGLLREDYPGIMQTPSAKHLMGLVQRKFGVAPSYSTCWRGRYAAANELRGDPEEGYNQLYSYLHMLEKANLGTITNVELDKEGRFKYVFIALGACIEGFKSMRKVLIVDSTFLKTCYGGVLMIATAQDPNRHTYPIAFAVTDGENDLSWNWFFTTLKTAIKEEKEKELVFVSDRNTSLIKAVREVFPESTHGYCIFHLSQNVRLKVSHVNKEVVAQTFRDIAQIYTEHEFLRRYDDFRRRYPKAAEYLDKSVEVSKWARCYFPGARYNIDTSNCVESLNKVIEEARHYNLLPMMDAIVDKICEWFNKHRKESINYGSYGKRLVPKVNDIVHERCAEATHLIATELNMYMLEYSVVGRDGIHYRVDLRNKTCSCKRFDIDQFPCVHAIAALYSLMKEESRTTSFEIFELCSPKYYVEQWVFAYSKTIYPVPHKSEWNIPANVEAKSMLPPKKKKTKKGRRQVRRVPSTGEPQPKKKAIQITELENPSGGLSGVGGGE